MIKKIFLVIFLAVLVVIFFLFVFRNSLTRFFLTRYIKENLRGDCVINIEKRKARAAIIEDYFQKGYIGENKDAYLEIVSQGLTNDVKSKIERNIEEENSDRKIIYSETAQKNGITISEVAKVFFNDHYNRAQQGYWFQIYDEKSGNYTWIKK